MKVLGSLSLQSIERVWREDLESFCKEDWATNLSQMGLNLVANYNKGLASSVKYRVRTFINVFLFLRVSVKKPPASAV